MTGRFGKILDKWLATIGLSINQVLTYRLNFVLLVIGPTLVFFFIKYQLWTSIFALTGAEEIQGYSLTRMLQYQGWILVGSYLAQSYNSSNLGEDIRLGRVSTYLIYPFDFWEFHGASFIGSQVVQFGVALITIACAAAILDPTHAVLLGLVFSIFVSAFWFVTQFTIGLLAFWLEEVWFLRVIFVITSGFLSGAIIPLDLYPAWLRTALDYTPFPYINYYAAKIFMGEVGMEQFATSVLTLLGWIIIGSITAAAVWKRGMRLYTAAGM